MALPRTKRADSSRARVLSQRAEVEIPPADRQYDYRAAARRSCEGAGANGCIARRVVAQRSGAGEAPCAADEHAHADAFGLDVAD